MDYHPHDTLAKLIVDKLVSGRENIPEAELRIPIRSDVLLRPGPPLRALTGLLGELVGTGVTVMENYHGRPRPPDLMRARAKGALACALEQEKRKSFGGTHEGRVLIIAVGLARRALRLAYRSDGWREKERGYHVYADSPRHVYVDLLRLEVNPRTAWLHVLGNGPRIEEALGVLVMHGGEEVAAILSDLRQEVSFMPQVQKGIPDRDDSSGALRFIKAWERAQLLVEGERKGKLEGKLEGKLDEARRALTLVMNARFANAGSGFALELEQISSIDRLEALLRGAALASSASELEQSIQECLAAEAKEQVEHDGNG